MTKGLILAAPNSGAGKTTLTFGLLRALQNTGINIRGAKSGPDYIDRRFHEAASGAECVNLDAWAMSAHRLHKLCADQSALLIEGAMGLFDGAPPDGAGSVASLAKLLNLPIVLVLDASKQAQSIAALLHGFVNFDPDLTFAGVILNKTGSKHHEQILRTALQRQSLPILGILPRDDRLGIPSRHLGLIQAQEITELENIIAHCAEFIAQYIDLTALTKCFGDIAPPRGELTPIPPLAQRISIARDAAFAFCYPHLLSDWRAQGAELQFFSPLNDHPPPPCDAVYLPGGYPELYAGQLANATSFKAAMQHIPIIYGECGGYMCMGKTLVDSNGQAHDMLGLLDLVTSFEKPKLHLGYRMLRPVSTQLFPAMGHEFHFARTIHARGEALFHAKDTQGQDLGKIGLVNGRHFGSFGHIIDRYEHDP